MPGSRANFYPTPEVRDDGLWVKHSWAWLFGVRIELDEQGYLLRGVEDVLLPRERVRMKETQPWFPLSQLAAASRAKVELDPRERWLQIDPQYPTVGWN